MQNMREFGPSHVQYIPQVLLVPPTPHQRKGSFPLQPGKILTEIAGASGIIPIMRATAQLLRLHCNQPSHQFACPVLPWKACHCNARPSPTRRRELEEGCPKPRLAPVRAALGGAIRRPPVRWETSPNFTAGQHMSISSHRLPGAWPAERGKLARED